MTKSANIDRLAPPVRRHIMHLLFCRIMSPTGRPSYADIERQLSAEGIHIPAELLRLYAKKIRAAAFSGRLPGGTPPSSTARLPWSLGILRPAQRRRIAVVLYQNSFANLDHVSTALQGEGISVKRQTLKNYGYRIIRAVRQAEMLNFLTAMGRSNGRSPGDCSVATAPG